MQAQERTERIIFQSPGALNFKCTCGASLTWGKSLYRYKNSEKVGRPAVDRRNCQGRMMTARCPDCHQPFAKRMSHAQLVPDSALERVTGEAAPIAS